jgi:hypothetical protein
VTGNAVSSNALTVRQFGTGNVFSAQTTTGSTALFVGANGNVGVGTTGPQTALQVSGPANTATNRATPYANAFASVTNDIFYGTTSQVGLEIGSGTRASGDNDRVYKYVLNTINNATVGAGVDFQILGIPTAAGSYTSDGTARNRVTIRYDGNVGIGVATPVAPLTVYTAATGSRLAALGSNDVYMTLGQDGTNGTNGSYIQCYAGGSSTAIGTSAYRLLLQPYGSSVVIGATSDNGNKLQVTGTSNFTGNVGIGTASPTATFTVYNGDIKVQSSYATPTYAFGGGLRSFVNPGVNGGVALCYADGTASGALQPLLYVSDSGGVGIGTSRPSYPLHVATSPVSLNGVAFRYFNYTTTVLTQANPGNLGISIYAQGDVVSTTGIVVTSDRRAKVLEEPPTEPYLNLVDKIQVHQYSWIDKIEKSANKKIGFFAQEVEEVVPDAVGKNTDVVPTIYKQADAFTESTITVTNHGLTTEKKLEVVDLENGKTKIDIVRVIDADNLEVKFEKVPKDKLFVVGPEVDDSRLLNHDYLMAVGFGGLKELHALVKSQQTTIEMLTERLAAAGL